jgi:hypothetical protein
VKRACSKYKRKDRNRKKKREKEKKKTYKEQRKEIRVVEIKKERKIYLKRRVRSEESRLLFLIS